MSEKKQYLIASSTNEWYTPPVYIDAVRAVLGSIQFDPFSCEVANTLVGADDYYTAADDATMTPWPVVQTVFANPPYERGLIDRCINTIIHNHRVNGAATIVLVNVATDARWFQMALGSCNAVCFTAKRIRFVKSDGITLGGSNTRGQAFFYFGGDTGAFARVFTKFGSVLKSSLQITSAYPTVTKHRRGRALSTRGVCVDSIKQKEVPTMQLGLFTTVRQPQPWLTCYDVGIYTVSVDGAMVMITNRATGHEVIRFALPAGVMVRDVVAVVEAGGDWLAWSVADWYRNVGRR